jgi:hypothetical protein
VPLRQPHCTASAVQRHSSFNDELHYRVRQVSTAAAAAAAAVAEHAAGMQ